ncbi:TetR/AcrR family transcriptional regulator [Psychromonas algicola]|uniref:TetR/AcrR family transcriptional regulator n=1 Tax=Psychromonas algicola TaxID=2555642 RepID=UPI001ABBA299|nr:TetR/AcrR family transcriptional regulator [Psychromonas sp. RZ5]
MTQKKIGRPRAFDKNEALTAAMKVFWIKGYDGASMKDLTSAMKINSPSLYSVFGDKHALYLASIDNYTKNNPASPLVIFESEPNIEKAIRAFMKAALDSATKNEFGTLGCFLSSSVATTAGVVDGVQEKLKTAILEADARLVKRFEFEKQNGVLASDFPSEERARLMFDLRQGYTFRARAGLKSDSMENDLSFRVKMVLGE